MVVLQPQAAKSLTMAWAAPAYRGRLADSRVDLVAAQALRFEVFNREIDEGLVQSYDSGLNADPFDNVCDHLIVEDTRDGSPVGTHRLQTGARAQEALGYCSEREFDFTPFESMRTQPVPDFACALQPVAAESPRIPRLLSAYLAFGAGICGPPAIDREFRSIDFLTWIDVESPSRVAMQSREPFVV